MTPAERQEKVMCIDSDLGESCGINKISQAYPEIFYHGGIMERGNFSAAAGFGMETGKQGIFSFLEGNGVQAIAIFPLRIGWECDRPRNTLIQHFSVS